MSESRNQELIRINDGIKEELKLLAEELWEHKSDIDPNGKTAATIRLFSMQMNFKQPMEESLAQIDFDLQMLAIRGYDSELKNSATYLKIIEKIAKARKDYPLSPAEEKERREKLSAEEKEWREQQLKQLSPPEFIPCMPSQENGNRHHLFSEKKNSQPDNSTVAVKAEQTCFVM